METNTEKIERFEEETGLDYDTEGPVVFECEHCGCLVQYITDHDCYGTKSECGQACFNEPFYGQE